MSFPVSQDIGAIPSLCQPIGNGHYRVVVGSYDANALNASCRERACAYAQAKWAKTSGASVAIVAEGPTQADDGMPVSAPAPSGEDAATPQGVMSADQYLQSAAKVAVSGARKRYLKAFTIQLVS